MRPTMARLTLARKIATIALTLEERSELRQWLSLNLSAFLRRHPETRRSSDG